MLVRRKSDLAEPRVYLSARAETRKPDRYALLFEQLCTLRGVDRTWQLL